MTNHFKSAIILLLFSINTNAQKNKILILYPSTTKEHPVKIVLKENATDTINSTIVLQYNVNDLTGLFISIRLKMKKYI